MLRLLYSLVLGMHFLYTEEEYKDRSAYLHQFKHVFWNVYICIKLIYSSYEKDHDEDEDMYHKR